MSELIQLLTSAKELKFDLATMIAIGILGARIEYNFWRRFKVLRDEIHEKHQSQKDEMKEEIQEIKAHVGLVQTKGVWNANR